MNGYLQIGNKHNHPLAGYFKFNYTVSQTPPEAPGLENQLFFVCKNPVEVYLGYAFTTSSQAVINRLYVTVNAGAPMIPLNDNLFIKLGQAYLCSRSSAGPSDADRIAAYVYQNGQWVQFSEAAS